MSKKYIKKNKAIITGLICALLGVGTVGVLGAVTKGFQDWDIKISSSSIPITSSSLPNSSVEEPIKEVKHYYLEMASDTISTSEVTNSVELKQYLDTEWVYFYDYEIYSGQAFRVKIITEKGQETNTTYNNEMFTWGNIGNVDFVYWTGASGVTWYNAIQDFGNGLYAVDLSN